MKMDKQNINELLKRWLKWDADLWGELRDIQIKLIYDRFIKELSYQALARKYTCRPAQVYHIIRAIIHRIDKKVSPEIATLLREINSLLDKGERSDSTITHQISFGRIYLN